MAVLFWLLCGHALCDFPLQGDFLSRGKDHRNPLLGVPWQFCLFAHALIHAGAVALITGNLALGVAEFVCHSAIDYAKCDDWFGFAADQTFHIGCKVVWAAFVLVFGPVNISLPGTSAHSVLYRI